MAVENIEDVEYVTRLDDKKHHDFSTAFAKTIALAGTELKPVELIAIISYGLGGLLCLLPDELVTSGKALELIQRNLEAGNTETNELLEPLNMLISKQEEPSMYPKLIEGQVLTDDPPEDQAVS